MVFFFFFFDEDSLKFAISRTPVLLGWSHTLWPPDDCAPYSITRYPNYLFQKVSSEAILCLGGNVNLTLQLIFGGHYI